jgi:hypothetical protein
MWVALRPIPPGLELTALGSGARAAGLSFTAAGVAFVAGALGVTAGGCEPSVAAPHAMHRTAPTTLRKSHDGHTTANVRVSRATMRDS